MKPVKTGRGMADREWRPAWSPEENRILDACTQGVLAGQFDSVASATQVCIDRLRRARPGLPRRSWWAARSALKRRLRAAGFSGRIAAWTPDTDRIIRSYARAVLRHRFRTVTDASPACVRELVRLRREQPGRDWGKPWRQRTVENRLYRFARAAGWTPSATRQWPAALKVYDRYADRLVAGDFPSIRAAARACIEFLRSRPRTSPGVAPLGLPSLATYISRRARAAGLPSRSRRWSAPEVRVIDRHAAAVQRDDIRPVDAGADSYRELKRLWRSGAGRERTAMPRSEKAVGQYLRRQLQILGVPVWRSPYTRAEHGLLRRYARALAQGHYRNVVRAATACRAELIARHQALGRHYAARSFLTVRSRLGPLAREFGWHGPGGRLHPEGERLLRLYAQKLARGEYTGWYQAAVACHAAMTRLCERRPELRPRAVTTIYRYLKRSEGRTPARLDSAK